MEQFHGSAIEVLLVFFHLGCTSFGGPIAHLGYFQKELVERRKWCSLATLTEIIALAQSLPGPASSQTGFALGILRAGLPGGFAAWIGFTLPSALLMLAFSYGHFMFRGRAGDGVLHGLQLAAVAVVAQAALAMQRSLAPDRVRMAISILAAGVALFGRAQFSTGISIAAGAIAGLVLLRNHEDQTSEPADIALTKTGGTVAAIIFLALLLLLPLLAHYLALPWLRLLAVFYRSGALVFGGGHVVLPLLEGAVVAPGLVTQQTFLAGYGAVQALPGPLFSFAAYHGASVRPSPSALIYGCLGLIGLFSPGLLAMAATLPFWSELRRNRSMRAALAGINASVVGILIAALYRPLWISTILSAADFWLALCAFALLTLGKLRPWIVVASLAAISAFHSYL
jgi:chromate transporter